MSPEQAEMSALGVDTRSDIYSLGVLLYELLTGGTPFAVKRLRAAALDEMLRIIREEEPPKPSTRLSTTEQIASIAAQRKIEPARLTGLLRGELDWIVMKALEKDRTRRYETASGLARDIQRYLDGDPVEAGPPSAVYRLRKFARKHRAALATAAAFLAVLVVATVFSTVTAIQASHAAERERQARHTAQARLGQLEKANDLLASIFLNLDPRAEEKQGKPLRAILVERLDRAAAQLDDQAIGDPVTVAKIQSALASTFFGLGEAEKSRALYTKVRQAWERILGPDHPDTLQSRTGLGWAYQIDGRIVDAVGLTEETLKRCKAKFGPDHPYTLDSRNCLANAYLGKGRTDEAI